MREREREGGRGRERGREGERGRERQNETDRKRWNETGDYNCQVQKIMDIV